MIIAADAQHMRNAKPGAGANNADRATLGERLIRAAEMAKLIRAELRNRVADGVKIIDETEAINLHFFRDHRGPDNPRIVGEFEHLSAHRTGDCNPRRAWQSTPGLRGKILPRSLETGMFGGFERHGVGERMHPALAHLGKRKACMSAADINSDDFHQSDAALNTYGRSG